MIENKETNYPEYIEKKCVRCGEMFRAKGYMPKYISGNGGYIYYHFCFDCYKGWNKNKNQKGKCLIDSDSDED